MSTTTNTIEKTELETLKGELNDRLALLEELEINYKSGVEGWAEIYPFVKEHTVEKINTLKTQIAEIEYQTEELVFSSRFVKYSADQENNYYDDSDFYDMYIDTVENTIVKHIFGTTRFGGNIEFPHEFEDRSKDGRVYKYAKEVAIAQIKRELNAKLNEIETGDILKVTNKRARKFKNCTFKVTGYSNYTTQYGRIETEYAHGVCLETGEKVKTNIENCNFVELGDKHAEKRASRLHLGLRL